MATLAVELAHKNKYLNYLVLSLQQMTREIFLSILLKTFSPMKKLSLYWKVSRMVT